MNLDILIEKPQRGLLSAAPIRRAAAAVLALQGAPQTTALSIVITGDQAVQALNLRFLGTDAPTDVLSFPSGETQDADDEETYLGDIIISLDRAAHQAGQGGHSLEQEVQLLTVHACLHLLGFDHAEAEDKDRMWAAQAAALARLGNPLSPA